MAARNKVGFNSTVLQSYEPGRIPANMAHIGGWDASGLGGGVNPFIDFTTQKLNGSPTTSSGDSVQFHFNQVNNGSGTVGNGYDFKAWPNYSRVGDWNILCDVATGGTIIVAPVPQPGLTFSPTSRTATGTGNVLAFTPTYNPVFYYSPQVDFHLTTTSASGNDWVTNWAILAPGTPSTWTKFSDYDNYNRLSGKFPGSVLRGMKPLGISNNVANWSDLIDESWLNWARPLVYLQDNTIQGFYPVTDDTLANAMAQAVYPPTSQVCAILVEFTRARNRLARPVATDSIQPGQLIRFVRRHVRQSGDCLRPVNDNIFAFTVVDSTKIIFLAYSPNSTSPGGSTTTLAADHLAPSPGIWTWFLPDGGAVPHTAWLKYCADMQMGCWLNINKFGTDDFANQLGKACAVDAATNTGGFYPIEFDNEPWNGTGLATVTNILRAMGLYQNYLWTTTGGPRNPNIRLPEFLRLP